MNPAKDRCQTAARLNNDTAYGLTGLTSDSGLPIVVHRVPLTSLKPADLSSPDRIPDAALRDALWRATRDLSGKEFEKALLDFSRKDPVFKGIDRKSTRLNSSH